MQGSTLKIKLCELLSEIGCRENKKLPNHSKVSIKRSKPANEDLRILWELLDDLGIGVKYLLFDLEATRRENALLRRMLDESME